MGPKGLKCLIWYLPSISVQPGQFVHRGIPVGVNGSRDWEPNGACRYWGTLKLLCNTEYKWYMPLKAITHQKCRKYGTWHSLSDSECVTIHTPRGYICLRQHITMSLLYRRRIEINCHTRWCLWLKHSKQTETVTYTYMYMYYMYTVCTQQNGQGIPSGQQAVWICSLLLSCTIVKANGK